MIVVQREFERTASGVVALGIGCLLLSVGCETTPTVAPGMTLDLPAPYSGPGCPDLESSALRQVEKGWRALQRGDANSARAAARRAGTGEVASLLAQQAAVELADGDPLPVLEVLVDETPGYAAAWLTLSVAAERADDEPRAYEAARRGAELWPEQRWVRRSQDLHRRWVEDRVNTATQLLDAGQAASALDALSPALDVDPSDREAILLKARALIAEGDADLAEQTLFALPQDPDSMLLQGRIAESRSDWQIAIGLYTALPEDHLERAPSLNRAQLRWRISMMPLYVHQAMSSQELDRAGLATILVSVAPQLETMAGGEVPVMTDIMASEAQREILTAVRLGLLDADPIDRLFHPQRLVTAAETRRAIDDLCDLLVVDQLPWCSSGAEGRCIDLAQPVGGARVTGLVIGLVERGGV